MILAAKAIPQLMVPQRDTTNAKSKIPLRIDRHRESQTLFQSKQEEQHHHRSHKNDAADIAGDTINQTDTDHYKTSSFETALDQVLRLERESVSTNANSHHGSMETCVRDFFRV